MNDEKIYKNKEDFKKELEKGKKFEEYADEHFYKPINGVMFSCQDSNEIPKYRYGYVVGAYEQNKRDVDAFVEWLRKNWRNYIDTDRDGMIRFAGFEQDIRNNIF